MTLTTCHLSIFQFRFCKRLSFFCSFIFGWLQMKYYDFFLSIKVVWYKLNNTRLIGWKWAILFCRYCFHHDEEWRYKFSLSPSSNVRFAFCNSSYNKYFSQGQISFIFHFKENLSMLKMYMCIIKDDKNLFPSLHRFLSPAPDFPWLLIPLFCCFLFASSISN